MTQFQIEGGGVVQGVNKFFQLFQLLWPKTKIMPNKFTKNGVESSFSVSEKFVKKGWKKIQHATKEPFFSLFLEKKKKVQGHNF